MVAAACAGAAAILTPYQGLGMADAVWTALAGGSGALSVFRWMDYRRLARAPIPEPEPELPPRLGDPRMTGTGARGVIRQLSAMIQRQRMRQHFRGYTVASVWDRIDDATQTLAGLAPALQGPAAEAVREGARAQSWLRDLAWRARDVEHTLRFAPTDASASLKVAHQNLVSTLTTGVEAYERLVAAAAECAAHTTGAGHELSARRLEEATDRLAGIARGLQELRDLRDHLRWN